MKKIVLFITALVFTSICVTSCLKDSQSTAEIYYVGVATNISYTDSVDTVWQKNIAEALNKFEVFSTKFVERDTTTSGISQSAVLNCNYKAYNYYKKMLGKVSLAEVKKNIFNAHADSLTKIGITSVDSIKLQPFKLATGLWSYSYGYISSDTTLIN